MKYVKKNGSDNNQRNQKKNKNIKVMELDKDSKNKKRISTAVQNVPISVRRKIS